MKNYRSELVGAFGDPIDENPTGVMEEAAFDTLGLDFRYLTIKLRKEDLAAGMAAVKAFNMRGINLTIPHKVAVLKYLDELSPAAEIIGAVNMVVNNDGNLWGENTDGKGFMKSLTDNGVSVQGKKMIVLGAGGAARAICIESALAGAEHITVVNIEHEQGDTLVNLINSRTQAKAEFIYWDKMIDIPEGVDILANATSVGLYPNINEKPNINYKTINKNMVVSDVIFNDPNSLFLQEAKVQGAKAINGLGMLVNQGALNFALWTGREAPVELMISVLKKEFGLT